ncbi:MAG: hypothetical protein RL040_738 [Bacteroidota bacterium]
MKTLQKFTLIVFTLVTLSIVSCTEDPCADVSCLNGGTCNEGTCACAAGYEGADCGTEQRAKFISTYNFNESCTSGTYSYTCNIGTSSAGVTKVLLSNFAALTGSTISASVSGTTLNIAQQNFSLNGQNWGIVGAGQINGSLLTITYTLTFPDNSTDACTATGTKQ